MDYNFVTLLLMPRLVPSGVTHSQFKTEPQRLGFAHGAPSFPLLLDCPTVAPYCLSPYPPHFPKTSTVPSHHLQPPPVEN